MIENVVEMIESSHQAELCTSMGAILEHAISKFQDLASLISQICQNIQSFANQLKTQHLTNYNIEQILGCIRSLLEVDQISEELLYKKLTFLQQYLELNSKTSSVQFHADLQEQLNDQVAGIKYFTNSMLG